MNIIIFITLLFFTSNTYANDPSSFVFFCSSQTTDDHGLKIIRSRISELEKIKMNLKEKLDIEIAISLQQPLVSGTPFDSHSSLYLKSELHKTEMEIQSTWIRLREFVRAMNLHTPLNSSSIPAPQNQSLSHDFGKPISTKKRKATDSPMPETESAKKKAKLEHSIEFEKNVDYFYEYISKAPLALPMPPTRPGNRRILSTPVCTSTGKIHNFHTGGRQHWVYVYLQSLPNKPQALTFLQNHEMRDAFFAAIQRSDPSFENLTLMNILKQFKKIGL